MLSRLTIAAVTACSVSMGYITTSAMAETKTVQMKFPPPQYEPKSVTVKVGDKVEWVNASAAAQHTATPDAGQPDPFTGSPTLDPGQKYSIDVKGEPRTIKYHCQIHGAAMAGEIIVTK